MLLSGFDLSRRVDNRRGDLPCNDQHCESHEKETGLESRYLLSRGLRGSFVRKIRESLKLVIIVRVKTGQAMNLN